MEGWRAGRYLDDPTTARTGLGVKSRSQGSLWVDSPCSLNYPTKLPSLQRVARFQLNSIYHRDDPHRPARVVDEFLKPDLLLLQFRRNIREIDKASRSKEKELKKEMDNRRAYLKGLSDKLNKRSTASLQSGAMPSALSPKEKEVMGRLCPKNPRLFKQQYDRFGNRSRFYDNEGLPLLEKASQGSPVRKPGRGSKGRHESFFTESERLDISRPDNFNPGPGAYFQERESKKIYSHHFGDWKDSQAEHHLDAEDSPQGSVIDHQQ